MKKALIICLILILTSCSSSTNRRKYCPICDAPCEYEIDEYDVADWLRRNGFVVLEEYDITEFAWRFFVDDPEQMSDFMSDYAIDFLTDEGWTLIPQKGYK